MLENEAMINIGASVVTVTETKFTIKDSIKDGTCGTLDGYLKETQITAGIRKKQQK